MPSVKSLLAGAPAELRFDTELLIARALGWNRAKVFAFGEVEPTADVLEKLAPELARLHAGEPLAYITGSREFFGLEFTVSPDVLIPRADTELLVELAIDQCPTNARVADLGTGSGAIAVSLKHARPDLSIVAVDRSAAALTVAANNAARHGCDIECVISDWYQNLNGQFDVVISNPPYIRADDPHLPSLRFEPVEALVAGALGLDDYKKLAAGAATKLAPGGLLFVEQGADQADAVANLFTQSGLTDIVTYNDLAGHCRVTRARKNES